MAMLQPERVRRARRLANVAAPELPALIGRERDLHAHSRETGPDSFAGVLAREDLQFALMRPIHLAPSAWLEHLPFAFWLIHQLQPAALVELGTHHGCSYFAFCQAVDRLALNSRCYAVDTWTGDAHAGFYGEEVYRAVKTHNDERYSRFSRLVRSTFDEAAAHFPDKSIDLLHIDGLHTRDAVQHDLETWQPKLSDRAVLLLHDTNVRERGFGVASLLSQLRASYPVAEFTHGHGLGIVGIGAIQSAGLRALFEAFHHEAHRRDYAEFFARLGRACDDAQAVRRSLSQPAPAPIRPASGVESTSAIQEPAK